jgi:hypothetical protein
MSGSFLYKTFETDTDLEREGIVVNFGSVKFSLARAGGRNKAFKDTFTAKAKKHRIELDNETMSDEVADRIMAESYAEAVILGWWTRKENEKGDPVLDKEGNEQWEDHIVNSKGKKVKYSVDECVRLLLDLPDLFSTLQSYAQKAANFRKEFEEADEGNSEQS